MKILRTPDERFAGLTDWPFEPRYMVLPGTELRLQLRLAEHDIPLGHWMYLRILWEKDGLTKRELSLEVGVMEPTAFVALKGMEEAGLVRFEKRDDNKKNIYVYLTDKGRGLRRQLVPLAEEVNAVAARGIAQEELQVTRKVLLQMLVNLNTQE